MKRNKAILLIAGLFLLPAFCMNATGENGNFPEFKSFDLLTQRNIFDPNRRKYIPPKVRTEKYEEPREDRPKPKRVDRFNLLGMMTFDGKGMAIFEGTQSEFNVEIQQGGKLAGFEMVAINTDNIVLKNGEKQFTIKIGSGMKRTEGEAWELATDAGSYTPAKREGSSTVEKKTESSSGGTSSKSDILKRMMERRQKELEDEKSKAK